MKIDFALHSVDSNPLYSDFWTPVSKIWKLKFDIEPVLIVVMEPEQYRRTYFDSTFGTVVNVAPVDGIPHHLQAQWVRFWYTNNFLNDTCIISDIDMFPISKDYFCNQIEDIPNDKYVHLYADMLPYLPVCYHVATGRKFKEVLQLKESFKDSMSEMMNYDKSKCITHMGMEYWGIEEAFSGHKINSHENKEDFVFLKRPTRTTTQASPRASRRIDRDMWGYDKFLLKNNYYIDCHSLRPYNKHQIEIDKLVKLILENERLSEI